MNINPSTPTIGVIFHPKFPPEKLADYARKPKRPVSMNCGSGTIVSCPEPLPPPP